MSLWVDIAVLAASIPVLFLLTQPEELRRHRWWRILASLPLIFCVLTFFLPLFIAGLGILAVIWSDILSHYAGGWFSDFLHRDVSSETGIKPDFRYARNHRRDGERDQAIACIRHELGKDPKNFEGHLLLAEIYEDLNQPREALAQLEIIIDNTEATPDQKEVARREQDNCRQLQRHLDEVALLKQSISR
jgi:tetratricopeptide (TPR) repeat protein